MKKMIAIQLLLLVFTFAATAGQERTPLTIEQRIHHLVEGWNNKNAILFSSPFAADGRLIIPSGQVIEGKWNIASSHGRFFATIGKTSQIDLEIKEIRALSDGVTLVYLDGVNHWHNPEMPEAEHSRMVIVFQQTDNAWEIQSLQITRQETAE
ncbi:MAG TPA: SgcJ/EcaC family oxidoreductase [Calditrichia bacterium]|nr:SgcJ/EcaC family oxidoreductase [Calditrichia bacterium]HQV33156.1 SgcJ/EcaC family oxidoreductase [Calditrichia bacterium]